MSVNNGRALWKPYESPFGRAMRFIAANPGLDWTKSGRKQLQDLEDLARYPSSGHRVSVADCETYVSLPDDPRSVFPSANNSKVTSICPKCSLLGFHSWLFEMEWLTSCPVHGVPFRIPGKRESIARLCRSHELKWESHSRKANKSTLLNPSPFFKALNPIARFCHLDSEIVPVNLFNSISGACALSNHDSHFACDSIYVNFMLTLFPQSWFLIQGTDPPLRKIIKIEIDREHTPDLSRYYLTNLNIRCHYIRERVHKRIVRLVQSRQIKAKTEHEIQNYFVEEYFHGEMDILNTAYKIWQSIIQCSDDTSDRPRNFGGERLYYSAFGYETPLVPVPMHGFTIGKRYPRDHPTFINKENVLPLGLTLLVYEIDCWCLFRSILKFLVCADLELEAAPNGRMLSRSLMAKIPVWAFPNSYYSDDIGVYLIEDRFVTLFPYNYIDPSCRDIATEPFDKDLDYDDDTEI